MPINKPLRIGSRASRLAVAQAEWVGQEIKRQHPDLDITYQKILTTGDKDRNSSLSTMGGKGVFVKEIEEALLSHDIDLAVHSLKDVPQTLPPGLCLGPFPKREDAREVVISRSGKNLSALPAGSRIGTSSPRRMEQLKRYFKRHQFIVQPIRGNLDTRLKKVKNGDYDAIVMAFAGLKRLGMEHEITHVLEIEEMMPAPGQGCLGLELRFGDKRCEELIAGLKDEASDITARAERSFLQALGGNCLVPVAAYAEIQTPKIHMQALLFDPHSDHSIQIRDDGKLEDAELVGAKLAGRLLYEGGSDILLKIGPDKSRP